MRACWKHIRLACAGGAMLIVGGCVSSPQLADFFRVEISRITADVVGQLFTIFVNATT